KYRDYIIDCLPLKEHEIKRKIGIDNLKKLASNTFLNNSQIISEILKTLDRNEISYFPRKKNLDLMIKKIRKKDIYKFDYSDDILPELKITINGNKILNMIVNIRS
ncbi:hypothetical protein DMUE_6116, partial [Dictyocoela muelleri]